jgi:hypothetical protein
MLTLSRNSCADPTTTSRGAVLHHHAPPGMLSLASRSLSHCSEAPAEGAGASSGWLVAQSRKLGAVDGDDEQRAVLRAQPTARDGEGAAGVGLQVEEAAGAVLEAVEARVGVSADVVQREDARHQAPELGVGTVGGVTAAVADVSAPLTGVLDASVLDVPAAARHGLGGGRRGCGGHGLVAALLSVAHEDVLVEGDLLALLRAHEERGLGEHVADGRAAVCDGLSALQHVGVLAPCL